MSSQNQEPSEFEQNQYFWTESSAQDTNLEFQHVYEYTEPQIVENVIQVEQSLEIPMPTFKKMEEFEHHKPTALKKQSQTSTTQRVNHLLQELSEQDDELPSTQKLLIKNNQLNDQTFMDQLIQRHQLTELKCQFSNSNQLIFAKKIQTQDISKRADILAKAFLKFSSKLQLTENYEQSNILQNFSELKEQQEQLEIQQQFSNMQESSEQQQPESKSFEINDQAYDLKQKINNLYLQLGQEIDKKIYQFYQVGNLDECIKWKQRKDDLDQDFKNIKDFKQLIQIMEVFKLHYNL